MNESDVLDGEDKNANKISIMSFKELGLPEVTKADLIYNDNYCTPAILKNRWGAMGCAMGSTV